jgi:hypothetical protein
MKKNSIIAALLIVSAMMFCNLNFCNAQQSSSVSETPDSLYIITLKNGSQLIGKLISSNDSTLVIESSGLGQVSILRSNIKEYKPVPATSMKSGEYWFPNPNATRYFFSPCAINLKQGEGYYQNTYLVLQSFYVGVTDFISIGGGFEILALFARNSNGPIFFLTAKGGQEVARNLHLGAGIIYASIPESNNYNGSSRISLGAPFGLVTYGNTDANMTLGCGFGFKDKDWQERPLITLSGMARASRKIAFVTENWVVPVKEEKIEGFYPFYSYTYEKKYRAYISYGLRFFGEKLSVDLGFVNSKDIAEEIIIGIPYLDFVVKF